MLLGGKYKPDVYYKLHAEGSLKVHTSHSYTKYSLYTKFGMHCLIFCILLLIKIIGLRVTIRPICDCIYSTYLQFYVIYIHCVVKH